MISINWDQFKIFKQERPNPGGLDNFQLLLEFVRGSDTLMSPEDLYEILAADELSAKMLEKRELHTPLELEEYLYKLQTASKR